MSFLFMEMLKSLRSGMKYISITLILTFVPVTAGIILGTLIAIVRVLKIKFLAGFFKIVITILKGIPTTLILLVTHLLFTLQFNHVAEALGLSIRIKDVSTIYIGIFVLCITATTIISETIRGGLLSVEEGQYEAGYTVGLTTAQTLRKVVIPQMVPVVIPVLTSNIIGLMKNSSIVFVIGVMDILNGALIPSQSSYSFLEGYVAAALIYWILCICVEQVSKYLESRLSRFRRKLG